MNAQEPLADNPAVALKSIWMALLEVESVSASDNFIEMGGNSLLATMFAARFEEETGIALDIQDIFQLSLAQLTEILHD